MNFKNSKNLTFNDIIKNNKPKLYIKSLIEHYLRIGLRSQGHLSNYDII